jgi:hypothetical protein
MIQGVLPHTEVCREPHIKQLMCSSVVLKSINAHRKFGKKLKNKEKSHYNCYLGVP